MNHVLSEGSSSRDRKMLLYRQLRARMFYGRSDEQNSHRVRGFALLASVFDRGELALWRYLRFRFANFVVVVVSEAVRLLIQLS